jgi:smad nuclear-interacting protein 1
MDTIFHTHSHTYTHPSNTHSEWGQPPGAGGDDAEGEGEKKPTLVDKPNFGLTGALAKDSTTGNVYKGVVLKWTEPDDARKPDRGWRLYVFKNGEVKDTLHLHRQSAYLIGRHDVADLKVEHPSCSKQHAVLQFRQREIKGPSGAPGDVRRVVKPYLMDLESVNKTKLNGEEIPPARYVELRTQDTIQFGLSSREYVLMHEDMVGGGGGGKG